jgi:CheY-like chemotaxis protein
MAMVPLLLSLYLLCKRMNEPILIVDDEPDMCWVISHILQSQGLSVITAYCGEDACFKLAHHKFSWVFLDAKLPDMDGLEVARRTSAILCDKPKIILVSGYHYCDDPVIRYAISEGIIDKFLAKPFTNTDLLKVFSTG